MSSPVSESVGEPAAAGDASPPLAIHLLGGFSATVQGTPLRKLRTRHGSRLLALLALANGTEWQRVTLAGRLWPDSDADDAAASLRRALTDLREALGPEAARLESPTYFTLRLDLNGGAACDALAFDRVLAEGTLEGLNRAIDLYRGPLMPDLDAVLDADGELQTERNRRQQAFLQAIEERAEQRRVSGQAVGAIDDLRRLLAADPMRESASRALMELLIASDDRAGAMAEYLRLRRELSRELGTKPERATRVLYERIQKGNPNTAPVRAGNETANHETLAQGNQHNLPARLTRFIGREAVVAAVRDLLGGNRLLTLTGTGGAGKTRLAQQIAGDVLGDFPGGVWLVELAPLPPASDRTLIARAMATVLGVPERPQQSLTASLIEHLKDKRLLLLLDNCEHLLSACAHLAADLLSASPHLVLLATSREPLGIFGEQTYRVPSLTLPGPKQIGAATAASLSAFEAARLFADRAVLARPDFQITDGNAPLVARLCQQLDGIPLALELAAARVRAVPLEQMVARLDDRFRLLTVGDRTALPRQQTLRALVDWSYDLLSEPERQLLARLSVFVGGWTLDAAEAVCEGDSIVDSDLPELLTSLVDKSLVQTSEEAGTLRYHLLETLRQYAAEKLEDVGETAATLKRHRDWYAALTQEADREIFGPDQLVWLMLLEAEYGNMRSALEWCKKETIYSNAASRNHMSDTNAPEMYALRMVDALGFFWQVHSHFAEGREHLEWVLQALQDETGATPHTSPVARAFSMAGTLAAYLGDLNAANAHFSESLAIYRMVGEKQNAAILLGNLASLASHQNDWASAWALFAESLALARDLDDKMGIAGGLCNLGDVAAHQGDYPMAQNLLQEAREVFRGLGENHGESTALNNLGEVATAQGDYAAAQPLFAEALAIRRSLGDRRGVSFSLRGLAEVRLHQGDASGAVVLWGAADALRESIGFTLTPSDQARFGQALAEARKTLAASEAASDAAFSATWEKGRAMPWEQAVAYALGESAE